MSGGRIRGRGRATLSFNVEDLGFRKGESLPGSILQPPALFPQRDFKAVPLLSGDEYDYLLALKQEFRGTERELPYYYTPQETKRDIERYSDKYQSNGHSDPASWQPDWSRLPSELRPRKKRARTTKSNVKPNVQKKAKVDVTEITKTLEELEKKEESAEKAEAEGVVGEKEGGSESEEEKEGETAEQGDEEEFYEEELEEETDYNTNYFDNGEVYGQDDEEDAVEDGPVY